MKKIMAILALAAVMIGSLGHGGLAISASYYEDIESALPAQPVPYAE